MTEFKTDIIYSIDSKNDSWRGKDYLTIKSNLSDDKIVECGIAKSLRDYLVANSATLEPDKLLIQFAEAQRRHLETTIEGLDDLALTSKNHCDSLFAKLNELDDIYNNSFDNFAEKFTTNHNKISSKLQKDINDINDKITLVGDLKAKLDNINNYKLDNILDLVIKLNEMISKDKELVQLVLNYK